MYPSGCFDTLHRPQMLADIKSSYNFLHSRYGSSSSTATAWCKPFLHSRPDQRHKETELLLQCTA